VEKAILDVIKHKPDLPKLDIPIKDRPENSVPPTYYKLNDFTYPFQVFFISSFKVKL